MGQTPRIGWLFDVDGVLTHPSSKRVESVELLSRLAAILRRGDPIGAITGRSLQFVEERLIDPLTRVLGSTDLLNLVLVVGEKGATTLRFGAGGERHRHVDGTLAISHMPYLSYEIKKMLASGFSEWMDLDSTKTTMVTLEMRDGADVDEFQRVQSEVMPQLDAILARTSFAEVPQVDATTIAIDIQHPRTGKALGAQLFVSFVRERRLDPRGYVAFGDSLSDAEMAQELDRLGLPVHFVFVGRQDAVPMLGTLPFPVTIRADLFDSGTSALLAEFVRKPPPFFGRQSSV